MKTNKLIKSVFLVLLVVILTSAFFMWGCSKNSESPEPEPGESGSLAGIWNGAFIFKPSNQMAICTVLIDPDGNAYFAIYDTSYGEFADGSVGKLSVSGGKISGTLNIYNDGLSVGTVQISDGQFMNSDVGGHTERGVAASFSGNKEPLNGTGMLSIAEEYVLYNTPSSFSAIQGNWTVVEENSITNIGIAADGKISGNTNWGAQFSGQVAIIDSEKNLYLFQTFSITGAGAPYDGTYHGLASIIDDNLVFRVVKNDQSFAFGEALSK